MNAPRAAVAGGLACYALSRVEYWPAFLPAAPASPRVAAFRGALRSQSLQGSTMQAAQGWAGAGLFSAAAAFVLGSVGMGSRRAGSIRAARVKVQAEPEDEDDLGPDVTAMKSPIQVYAQALMDTAAAKSEAVLVTKDVMKVKKMWADSDFADDKLARAINDIGASELQRAKNMVEIFEPFESTIMPKYIVFLAKKARLTALLSICNEYITQLYKNQEIAPVKVTTAVRLTEEQKNQIKDKMMEKTGMSLIKLIEEVNPSILGGIIVEWTFVDPENPDNGGDRLDLSLRRILEESAISEGVVAELYG